MNKYGRIDFIDNTRILLTFLVILVHTSVTYGGEGGWYITEETNSLITSVLLTVFNAICQSFFMSLFFLISGYFTAISLKRKNIKNFVTGRLLRLGLPLLFFFMVIGPFTVFLSDTKFYNEGFDYSKSIHAGPMWFAQALLIFTFFYLPIKRFLPLNLNLKRISLPFIIIFLSAATFIARAIWPMGEGLWGMQLGSFTQYILMFGIGTSAGTFKWEEYLGRTRLNRVFLIAGVLIVLMPVFMLLGEDPELGLAVFMGGVYWQAGLYAVWESAMCIVMSLALLALMYQKTSGQGPLLNKMARSSYGVYIIHAPVLVFISIVMAGFLIHPLLKFLITGSIVITATYLLSGLLVRLPGVKKVI